MKNFASFVLLMAGCNHFSAQASDVGFYETCIEKTEEFGYTKNWNNRKVEMGMEMMGDLRQVAKMKLDELAFSRPDYVIVCADNYYVHGI